MDNPHGTGTIPDTDLYLNAFFGKAPAGGSSAAFERLANLHHTAREQWRASYKRHTALQADPTRTPEAKLLDSAKHMRQQVQAACEQLAAAEAMALQEAGERRERMQRALRPADAVQALQDSEMRRYLLGLPSDARTALLAKAYEAADLDTIRAVAGVNEYLSGVGSETHERMRDTYLSVVASSDYVEVQAIDDALSRARSAVGQLEKHCNHYVDFNQASKIEALHYEDAA